jgi:hypothetical protein
MRRHFPLHVPETVCDLERWVHAAHDRVLWQCLVDTVMILRLHKEPEMSLLSERLLISQEGLCTNDVVIQVSRTVSLY